MGQNSNIEWTDHTFNPWIGCAKVSPGCAHCYAETLMATRYGRVEWGKGKARVRTSPANWAKPRAWNREAAEAFNDYEGHRMLHGGNAHYPKPSRPRVFCASLADWLDDEVPIEWLADLLDLIALTPHLDWLLLTKRPQNWRGRLEAIERGIFQCATRHFAGDWLGGEAPANVWVGTTVEDQERANERHPVLMSIPARVRFWSVEPMLSSVQVIDLWCDHGAPDWAIIGGESGPGAREFHLENAWDLILTCQSFDVAPFVKQLGVRPVTSNANNYDFAEHVELHTHGTEAAGARVILRDRKGGDITEWPEPFQVQEFPTP